MSIKKNAMFGVNKYGNELTDEEIQRDHHRTYVGGLWDELGQLQFNFLRREGLAPDHQLLDIGCGALRGGLHFISYLSEGCYCGLDVNESLIKAAHKELLNARLDTKNPQLLVDGNFDFGNFQRKFDYMLAVSVFTHLPSELVSLCLQSAAHFLKPDGVLFATVFLGEGDKETLTHEPGGIQTYSNKDPFHYTDDAMASLASGAGLRLVSIKDWQHPRAQMMAEFRQQRDEAAYH